MPLQNPFLWLALLCFLSTVASISQQTQSAIDIIIKPAYRPVNINAPITFDIEIINNELTQTIAAGSSVLFEANPFTSQGVLRIKKDIAPGSRRQFQIDLDVRAGAAYRHVPKTIDFHMLDKDANIVPTSSHSFSLRSDQICKSLNDWSPHKLTDHTWRWWMPQSVNSRVFGVDLINVCFLGIAGAGKSTALNTFLTAFLDSDTHESIRPIGAGEHVTIRIEDIDLTRSARRLPLAMRFWDSFGVTALNWPEDKIRGFLNGRLTSYSIFDLVDFSIDFFKPVALRDRIHVVLLFMPEDVIKNEVLLQRMIRLRDIAVREGYNPLLMITKTNHLGEEEKDSLIENVQNSFGVPKNQIIFVPFYGDSTQRDFATDIESITIVERIQVTAEAFIDAQPSPSDWERRLSLLYVLAIPIVLALLWKGTRALFSLFTREKRELELALKTLKDTMDAKETKEEVPIIATVVYKDNSIEIHVTRSTTLSDILPTVTTAFRLEDCTLLFTDKNDVSFMNSDFVHDCGDRVYIKLLTSS